jgi:hypothetical protein
MKHKKIPFNNETSGNKPLNMEKSTNLKELKGKNVNFQFKKTGYNDTSAATTINSNTKPQFNKNVESKDVNFKFKKVLNVNNGVEESGKPIKNKTNSQQEPTLDLSSLETENVKLRQEFRDIKQKLKQVRDVIKTTEHQIEQLVAVVNSNMTGETDLVVFMKLLLNNHKEAAAIMEDATSIIDSPNVNYEASNNSEQEIEYLVHCHYNSININRNKPIFY